MVITSAIFIYMFWDIIMLFFFAALTAYLLSPFVNFIMKKTKVKRPVAAAVVILLLLGIIVTTISVSVPALSGQITSLVSDITRWAPSFEKTIGSFIESLKELNLPDAVLGYIEDIISEADSMISSFLRNLLSGIVGKYGMQVQAALKKASKLEIEMVCPLHGFVWRKNIGDFIAKYQLWSTYTPEENGVMIAYASVYGNTENTAEILSSVLRDRGIKTVMFDVSVTPASEIVAAAFKYSHLVFASTTYNAGIFVTMEALISDLVAHNIQNRTVAIIENGSWAATSGKLIAEHLSKCKNINILENKVSLKSSLKEGQLAEIEAMADAIEATFPQKTAEVQNGKVAPDVFFRIPYGLYVLTAKEGEKDNGCIINTLIQVTDSPKRVSVAVNKANYTHDMIKNTGVFNVSLISEEADFKLFEHFGFHSGKDTEKFGSDVMRTANGLAYIGENTNAVISAKVINVADFGTHSVFTAEVTEAFAISDRPTMTYGYYFEHVKPKPNKFEEKKKGYVCKICGYVYEGDTLPEDFVCPLCKHGAEDFEKIV